MITKIEVVNFQSLKRAQLDLGSFTVIVGPSSSGKSALIRAFRALASNVRGTSQITRGQKQMAITARTDTHVITLERSERSGTYRIHSADGEQAFTKLGGEVPQAVTDALRLDPGPGSVNFAAQFDKPFLLDESGSVVARGLAELTRVDIIFDAVREANKIRNNATSTLRTRRSDLDAVKTRMADFQGLPDALKAFEHVERADDHRQELQNRIGRLEASLRALRITERALEKAKPRPLPDTGEFTELTARVIELTALIARHESAEIQSRKEAARARFAEDQMADIERQRQRSLKQAGVCPTCGQQIA